MVSIKFQGGPELEKAISALVQEMRPQVRLEALRQAGEPMRQRMDDLAPAHPSGEDPAPHIKGSIVMSPVRKVDGVALHDDESAIAIGPSKDAYHAWFIEHGWVHHSAARPFVRPAYDSEADGAMKTIGNELWNAISRRARSQAPGGTGNL